MRVTIPVETLAFGGVVLGLFYVVRSLARDGRSKERPLLRQAIDLRPSDFDLHPVWVHCHIVDYDEPWHDETDEETFRPWSGPVPVDPADAMFLVRSRFVLADGSVLPGVCTPQSVAEADGTARDLGTLQPDIMTDQGWVSFWAGIRVITPDERKHAYGLLGGAPEAVFPILFAAEPGLAGGITEGSIPGFCSSPDGTRVEVDR